MNQLESLQQEQQKLERLVELAAILSRQNDFQEVLRLTAQKAAILLQGETAALMMINPRTRQTVKTVFKEIPEGDQPDYHALQIQVSGWVIKNNRSFMSEDICSDSRFSKNLFSGIPIKSVLGVPLRAENILFGTLLILNIESEKTGLDGHLAYLEKFAAVAAPFLRNVQHIREYFEAPIPDTTLLAKYAALGLLGKSKKFVELLKAVEAAARCDVRVLLEGQSGSGKELVARAIHQFSARCDFPFVAIDCGAVPENLIESEFFGHVKGAFTGATADRRGLLEEAHQGTLFMDEIANLPLDMQAKFLRVLQSGEIRPLGSNKTRPVDVRIISASSKSLHKLVDGQQFREDLFYRLHVYPLQVPSLDDRHEDIPLLANFFLKKFSSQQGKRVESFHEEILEFMQQRHWTGNIRELENFVERLVTLAGLNMTILKREILPPDLKKELKKYQTTLSSHTIIKSLNESLSEYEAQVIRQALIANHWNQSKTARSLKISEQTLRYKMGKLGIIRPKG
jgi:transcriptional regulator with GAF, ATPase, and Fis domain